jgi:hypothetical protein
MSDFLFYSHFLLGDFRITRKKDKIIIFYSYYPLRISSFTGRNRKKSSDVSKKIKLLSFSSKRKFIIFIYFINKLTGIKRKNINFMEHNMWDSNGFFKVNTIRGVLKYSILRRFKKKRYFRDSIYFVNTILKLEDPETLSVFLIKQLQKDYHHNLFIYFIKLLLCICLRNFPNIFGVLIIFKGILGRHGRKKKKIIKIGVVPFNSYDSNIKFGFFNGSTKYGAIGVKIFINKKN